MMRVLGILITVAAVLVLAFAGASAGHAHTSCPMGSLAGGLCDTEMHTAREAAEHRIGSIVLLMSGFASLALLLARVRAEAFPDNGKQEQVSLRRQEGKVAGSNALREFLRWSARVRQAGEGELMTAGAG